MAPRWGYEGPGWAGRVWALAGQVRQAALVPAGQLTEREVRELAEQIRSLLIDCAGSVLANVRAISTSRAAMDDPAPSADRSAPMNARPSGRGLRQSVAPGPGLCGGPRRPSRRA